LEHKYIINQVQFVKQPFMMV